MIEPALWQSESMGRLTIRQRLMFIGMFSNADDQGRLRSSAPVIRSLILPFDDVTLSEVEADIQAIQKEDCIILYSCDGSRYAQIVNWWKYQTPQWAYKSLIPKPDGWSDRLRYRHGGEVITENWKTQEAIIDQDSIEQDSNKIVKAKGKRKRIGKGLGKENGAEKAPRQRDELFDAIVKVSCVDPATAGSSIAKVKQALLKAVPPYSPEEVLKFGEQWPKWKDNPPTVWQLKEQIGIVRQNGKGNHAAHQSHNRQPEYTPEQLAAAAEINRRRAEGKMPNV